MDSQSHRASPTRAEAVQGTLGVQPTGPQPTGSGKLGFAGPPYWWTPIPICWAYLLVITTNTNLLGLQLHQARTKENDHWPLEQHQPSSTTTTITTLAPLKPYHHVTLADSSGNCALQIHFDPAQTLERGLRGAENSTFSTVLACEEANFACIIPKATTPSTPMKQNQKKTV